MAAKVRNIFIAMFNFIKEQFNSFADTFIGEKLGIEKLQMTDFIDTEGISAEFGETGLADLFGGEDQVQNLSDFTDKSKEVWANYFAKVAELKQANAVLENENALANNQVALETQQQLLDQELFLREFEKNEAIKKINQQAQEFRDAKVKETEIQRFVTAENIFNVGERLFQSNKYPDFNEIQIEYMREPDVTLPKENLVKMVNFYD